MTVIVAARTKSTGKKRGEYITIASDTQLTDGWEKTTGAYPKIWVEEQQKIVVGAAGLVAAWQAVKYGFTWPHYPTEQDWEEWLVKEVRPLIMSALDSSELLLRPRKSGIDTGMCLIVATGNNLASMDSIGGVVVPRSGCVAIGSGFAQALGSLGSGPWSSDDVVRAAYAATQTDLGCGAPIYWADTRDYTVHEADLRGIAS